MKGVSLEALTRYLDTLLEAKRFSRDLNGIYCPSGRAVERLGLALEPPPDTAVWIERERLDALFLRRPWALEPRVQEVGVLAYHHAFDERLTTGFNPYLAEDLGLTGLEVLGFEAGRPLGMIGGVALLPLNAWLERLGRAFGGLEGIHNPKPRDVSRLCVVGAMRPALIYEAHERGAQLYVTGEYRTRAAEAVAATGITVVALGHARSESWGLGRLAGLIQHAFPELSAVLEITERRASGAYA